MPGQPRTKDNHNRGPNSFLTTTLTDDHVDKDDEDFGGYIGAEYALRSPSSYKASRFLFVRRLSPGTWSSGSKAVKTGSVSGYSPFGQEYELMGLFWWI